jgi:hypothetical protein
VCWFVYHTSLFPELILQVHTLYFPQVIDHGIIGNGKQVRFAFFPFYFVPVAPQLFKSSLYHITGIFLVPQVLNNEAVQVVGVISNTLVVFFLGHKKTVGVWLPML